MEREGNGEERFRQAAERAREELMRQLGGEAERLDRELADLSEEMTASAARVVAPSGPNSRSTSPATRSGVKSCWISSGTTRLPAIPGPAMARVTAVPKS